jgi:hypothetical protein
MSRLTLGCLPRWFINTTVWRVIFHSVGFILILFVVVAVAATVVV